MTREPIQIVELRQPRCALRFGVGACTATGTPKCYNTLGTCRALAAYDGAGSIAWRFVRPVAAIRPTYEETGEHIATNMLPILASVSTSSSRINVSSARDGESPFGVLGTCTVSLRDQPWDDRVGDFYRGDRANPGLGTFWAKWAARNSYYADMELVIYEGFVGQTLEEMAQRLYMLNSVDGPNADGAVTLKGVDPLMLSKGSKAMFPRTTNVQLYGSIDSTTTAVTVYTLEPADLTDAFGNTALRYARIGDEIIAYAAATAVGVDTGRYSLSGVQRAALGTTADSHADEDAVQRVGRYDLAPVWDIEYDLMTNHTPIRASFIPWADWQDEGVTHLGGFEIEGTVAEPTEVEDLLGELVQQCNHYIWWADRGAQIRMKAARPPQGAVKRLTDASNILKDSAVLTRDPASLYTRVFIHYGRRSEVGSLSSGADFLRCEGWIDANAERRNGNKVTELRIYSRWLRTRVQVLTQTARLLQRYSSITRYLSADLDQNDADIEISDEVDASIAAVIAPEGQAADQRWQVISIEDREQGHRFAVELQEFYFRGRFAYWMADDAPDYADATEEERAHGLWWADEDGLLPDGEEGYLWQ